jgi:hypothetical protein
MIAVDGVVGARSTCTDDRCLMSIVNSSSTCIYLLSSCKPVHRMTKHPGIQPHPFELQSFLTRIAAKKTTPVGKSPQIFTMPLSETPRALIATAIEPRLTRSQARNRDNQPDTPTTASSQDSVGSSDDELPDEAISSHGLLLDPFFGKSRLADRWLRSRLLPNRHEPHDASAFRSPGEQRPTTFRNVGYSLVMLLEAIPDAMRICARGQRFKFTIRFMDYFADAVLPVVSVVIFAQLFDLVQDALSGVDVTISRIFGVVAPAVSTLILISLTSQLVFKVVHEVWDFWLLKLSVDVQVCATTNVADLARLEL